MLPITPFRPMPVSPEGESRRAKLALVAATVGIAAALLAYAISPGVRHAVSHAAHSVRHSVGHVLHDHDVPKQSQKVPKRKTGKPGAAVTIVMPRSRHSPLPHAPALL
jgi:hypothetical protein